MSESRPLLVPLQIYDTDGERVLMDSPENYVLIMNKIAQMILDLAWEYPNHYPILVTYMVEQ